MTPEEAVITRLNSLGAVTAIVANRIYQLRLPQSPRLPAVRVEHISEISGTHLMGAGGLRRTRVQIDAITGEASGTDPMAIASNLARAIEGDGGGSGGASVSGLAGFRGEIGDLTIAKIEKVNSGSDYNAAELREIRIWQDFFVWWRPITA